MTDHRAILVILSIISLSVLHLVEYSRGNQQELEIHNTFQPELCDRKVRSTDVVTLHYEGTLKGETKVFDSSRARGQPFTFQIGIGQVILGWEKGLLGACVGEKRRLVIPPHLGYGSAKHDQIPPDSTLVFDVEVLKVADGPKPLNVFKEIDVDNDGRLSREEMAKFLKKQIEETNQSRRQPVDLGNSRNDPEHVEMVEEIFMHEDKDRDGYITHEEFSGPKEDHDEL